MYDFDTKEYKYFREKVEKFYAEKGHHYKEYIKENNLPTTTSEVSINEDNINESLFFDLLEEEVMMLGVDSIEANQIICIIKTEVLNVLMME